MSEDILDEQRARTSKAPLPQHIAIIMDGNGRWATRRGLPRLWGHRNGLKVVRKIVKEASRLGIKVLTLYAFSEENWGRPEKEVKGLMRLLSHYIRIEKEELNKQNIKTRFIGALDRLPGSVKEEALNMERNLSHNTGMVLNIALGYGARNELARACQMIAQKVVDKELTIGEIDPSVVSENLYTSPYPDPDLLIRTSGEQRISNFLLWQGAYSELIFTPTFWPDFDEELFLDSILSYQQRERRYGL